jgi:hypothetical protein
LRKGCCKIRSGNAPSTAPGLPVLTRTLRPC